MKITESEIPEGSLVERFLPVDYNDSFRCEVTGSGDFNADDIQVGFWTTMPGWVEALMKFRNILVRPFGLKSGRSDAGEFEKCIREGGSYRFVTAIKETDRETVLLLKDKHLNAYLSMIISGEMPDRTVTATTLVVYNNNLGKVYFFLIRPFHKLIVRRMLKRVIKRLQDKI